MPYILKIGSLDMSDYCLQGLSISTSAVYDGHSFTNVLGQTKRTYLGDRIAISAKFETLTQTQAQALATACGAATVSVSYCNATQKTDVFERPDVSSEMSFLGSDGVQYWNVSINMVCPLSGGSL